MTQSTIGISVPVVKFVLATAIIDAPGADIHLNSFWFPYIQLNFVFIINALGYRESEFNYAFDSLFLNGYGPRSRLGQHFSTLPKIPRSQKMLSKNGIEHQNRFPMP